MYTIISGTNRPGSHTLKVAKEYQRILKGKGIEAGLFSLEGVDLLKRDKDFEKIEEEVILPTTHFIIISPEYNGSFPGALKLLMDTSKNHFIWWNKKALLVGVSAGRAGNLRGMDHLADILNFLRITVHPNKLPISVIDKLLDGEKIKDENTLVSIDKQLEEFLSW
jgi:chromate reductase